MAQRQIHQQPSRRRPEEDLLHTPEGLRLPSHERAHDASRHAEHSADKIDEALRQNEAARTLAGLESDATDPDAPKKGLAGIDEPSAAERVRQQEEAGSPWRTSVSDKEQRGKKRRRPVAARLKRWAIGALVTAIVTFIGGFFAFAPHKMDVLLAQMEKKFYDRAERYTEKRGSLLLARYFAVYVFGNKAGISSCQKAGELDIIVTKDCFYAANSKKIPNTKLGQKFLRLKQARYEKFGLDPVTINYNPNALLANGTRGPSWIITAPSGETQLIDPNNPEAGTRALFVTQEFTGGNRASRNAVRDYIDSARKRTHGIGTLLQMGTAGYLDRQYGATRCIFFCNLRDKIDTAKVDFKKAWNGFLVDRIVSPINTKAGIFLECMFQSGLSCTEDNKEFRQKIADKVKEIRTKNTGVPIDRVLKVAEEYGKFAAEGGNLTKFITNKIMEQVGKRLAAIGGTAIVNAIPAIGQAIYIIILGVQALPIVLLFANMYTFAIGPGAQYASTQIKAATYTAAYQLLKVAADETRAAGPNFEILARGAETDSLEGVEKSFLWNHEIGSPGSFTNVAGLFAKKAYAASDYPYVCDQDGTPIDSGQVLCPNWRFNFPTPLKQLVTSIPGSSIAAAVANSSAAQTLLDMGNAVVSAIDAPFNAISEKALEALPQTIKDWLNKNLKPFTDKLADYAFGVPFRDLDDLIGAKFWDAARLGVEWSIFDQLRGGVDENNEPYGYGARVLTPSEARAQEQAFAKLENEEFNKLSLWDKIFSHDYTQSVASQFALAMPTNANQALAIASPGTLLNMFGSAMAPRKASALAPGQSASGAPAYGFTIQNLETKPFRNEASTTPCKNDRVYQKLKAGSPTDYGLGRAEFATENVCMLDEVTADLYTQPFTNEPFAVGDPTESKTGGGTTPPGDGVSSGQFAWPIAENDYKGDSSCFGPRGGGFHGGIDLLGKGGGGVSKILASDGGKVITAGPNGDAGNMVVLQHAGQMFTMYMHLARISVRNGQSVTKGQVIGILGTTGDSSGPHLHFTIAKGQPRNREPFSHNPLRDLLSTAAKIPASSPYRTNTSCSTR